MTVGIQPNVTIKVCSSTYLGRELACLERYKLAVGGACFSNLDIYLINRISAALRPYDNPLNSMENLRVRHILMAQKNRYELIHRRVLAVDCHIPPTIIYIFFARMLFSDEAGARKSRSKQSRFYLPRSGTSRRGLESKSSSCSM